MAVLVFSQFSGDIGHFYSFPTRRSSDLMQTWAEEDEYLRLVEQAVAKDDPDPKALACYGLFDQPQGRKSTRLNSSHVEPSYAALCWTRTNVNRSSPHRSGEGSTTGSTGL